jgi:hypothetical protein
MRSSWLLLAASLSTLAFALSASACTASRVAEARSFDCVEGTDCESGEIACDGDDPATFCDDCNPCTADANCTPCDELPVAIRDARHCNVSGSMPAFCAGKTGCVHVAMTTPAEVQNSCFPVADEGPVRAGVCNTGVCIANP